ncbi:hypothetical protein ABZ471_14490 [Streptomyces sp. NPDC005728]|uniref:hypothetical protein n=1 Tax=Streptomyces sp. NPDC005728 TaxID=3157054 RepID=UPI0033C730FF
MAKNKKQDRSKKQAPQSEHSAQQAQRSPSESREEQHLSAMSPADVARKGRQKSFGHN